jgi:peptide/nickel transport system substrate-binding protein
MVHRGGRLALSATVTALVLVVSGCAGSTVTVEDRDLELIATTPAAAGGAGRINWMLDAEPLTLDTDYQGGTIEDTVVANVCERLYQLQPDLTVRPWLVGEPEQPDPTTFVYPVREGVTFHDGSQLTAEDVLFSMKRHAEEGQDESDEYSNVIGIEQTGPMEVTVTLEEPDAQFKYRMAGDGGIVFNAELVERLGDDYGNPGQPDACSGPFRLKEWQAGSSLTLERYDDYWYEELTPLAEKIRFTWGGEWAMVNSLRTGAADGAYLDNPSIAPALIADPDLGVHFGETTSSWQLFPTDRGPVADARIRTALSLALNRDGMVAAAFRGIAEPWKLPIGSGTFGYARDAFETAYDHIDNAPLRPTAEHLARARELVAQAGTPEQAIVVASDGSSVGNVLANGVRDAALRIGLEIDILTLPPAQFTELLASPDARAGIDLIIDDWYISKPDALGMYDNALPGSVNNYVGFESVEFADTFARASATYDDTARAEQVIRLQQLYLDEMVSIPVAMAPTTLVLNKRLSGSPVSIAYLTYPWAADLGSAT